MQKHFLKYNCSFFSDHTLCQNILESEFGESMTYKLTTIIEFAPLQKVILAVHARASLRNCPNFITCFSKGSEQGCLQRYQSAL